VENGEFATSSQFSGHILCNPTTDDFGACYGLLLKIYGPLMAET